MCVAVGYTLWCCLIELARQLYSKRLAFTATNSVHLTILKLYISFFVRPRFFPLFVCFFLCIFLLPANKLCLHMCVAVGYTLWCCLVELAKQFYLKRLAFTATNSVH